MGKGAFGPEVAESSAVGVLATDGALASGSVDGSLTDRGLLTGTGF